MKISFPSLWTPMLLSQAEQGTTRRPRLSEDTDERGGCLCSGPYPRIPSACCGMLGYKRDALCCSFCLFQMPSKSPNSCLWAPPRSSWALEPAANPLCSPSLSVHGSVLSLASSASSTYSSVRPLMSLPLPCLPFHIPSDLLWLGMDGDGELLSLHPTLWAWEWV